MASLRHKFTVEDDVRQKAALATKWEQANPGLEWANLNYPEDGPKIYITKAMLFSDAYRSLSKTAMFVYQIFLAKRLMTAVKRNRKKVWICTNNGEIVFPYSEAENKYKISRKLFRDAIDELQLKGFIDITHQGKGGRPSKNGDGDMSTYWIDNRWEEYGTDDLKQPRNPRIKDTRQDRGWTLYNKTQREKGRSEVKNQVCKREPVLLVTSEQKGTSFLNYLGLPHLYLTDFKNPRETAWIQN